MIFLCQTIIQIPTSDSDPLSRHWLIYKNKSLLISRFNVFICAYTFSLFLNRWARNMIKNLEFCLSHHGVHSKTNLFTRKYRFLFRGFPFRIFQSNESSKANKSHKSLKLVSYMGSIASYAYFIYFWQVLIIYSTFEPSANIKYLNRNIVKFKRNLINVSLGKRNLFI